MLPRNTQLGMILGYRKNGTPIREIRGASEQAAEGGQGGDQGQSQASGQAGAPDGAQGQQAPAQQAAAGPTQADIDRLQAALAKERESSKVGKAAAAELAKLKEASQSEQERAIAAAVKEAETRVSSTFAPRLVAMGIKSAAAGKFQNPADAAALLGSKVADFVSDDGEVDEAAIDKAVDDLLKERPYLGAAKVATDMDGGQRGATAGGGDMNTIIRRQVGIGGR